jgi:hypothetical protein
MSPNRRSLLWPLVATSVDDVASMNQSVAAMNGCVMLHEPVATQDQQQRHVFNDITQAHYY